MGIGSCDYEGLQVHNMLLLQESWWSRTQFRIPENKLQSSVSAGKRRCRFQLKKSERIIRFPRIQSGSDSLNHRPAGTSDYDIVKSTHVVTSKVMRTFPPR